MGTRLVWVNASYGWVGVGAVVNMVIAKPKPSIPRPGVARVPLDDETSLRYAVFCMLFAAV